MTTSQILDAREPVTVSETVPRDESHLFFQTGLVGFPEAQRFTLVESGGEGVFELQSVDEGAPDFVVVAPSAFFPDYSPVIDDATAERLDLRSADEALVLLVVTLRERPEDASANLLAPLVVNGRTRDAAQVVLNDQPYPLRAPLLSA
jgi:flagellar assembly factor FliW